MLLSELLHPGLIKVGLVAESRDEAMGELVDLLVQRHEIPMSRRQQVLDHLLEHEQAHGSGMEKGIAVPHCLTDEVEDTLCVLGTAPHGIPFECLDGAPANLIVLLLLPKRNFAGTVRTLAGIEHLLEHKTLKDQLVAAETAQAAYDLIVQEERRTGDDEFR